MSNATLPAIGSTLYKLDSKGKLRVWSIRVEDHNGTADIVIESGLDGGALITTRQTIAEGKNIGRSNETTPLQQAISEADSRVEQQIRSGYVTDRADVRESHTLGSGIKSPMLAQKYHPTGEQKSSKTLDQMGIRGKRVHVQPKLDGNRCLTNYRADTTEVELYTRKGDRMLPISHIEWKVRQSMEKAGIVEDTFLDGELHTTAFTFNTLNGLLKKEFKSDAQKTMLEQVRYHVYDIVSDAGYDERYKRLNQIFKSSDNDLDIVQIVPSFEIEATDENIKQYLEKFLAEGYEGLMIRQLDKPYEPKRSWQLCKVKLFEDAEFKLVDIEEDSRGGFVGAFVLEMDCETCDRDGRPIKTFRAGLTGLSQEEGAEMLRNKHRYIGRTATVEYFQRSEYKVPRFPKLKGFRSDV